MLTHSSLSELFRLTGPKRVPIINHMGKYRLDSIAQLARQMRFTPISRRLEQLDAAEDLLLKLLSEQPYTLTEITCALTGYQPKALDSTLLTGSALQHDIGLLLEEVSETLQLHVTSSLQPVLSIEEVAQRLSVTSKTVQRWRRRGLPARRYTFADGKRRIGFRFSSVQRFIGSPSGTQQIQPAADRGRDLHWLLHNAAELASRGYWHLLVGERLAAASGLSPLAIAQILREQAADVAFASPPDAGVCSRVCELRQTGASLRQISSDTGLPLFGVYRVILENRVTRAIRKPVRFYDDPLYHGESAADALEQIIAQEPAGAPEESRIPRDLPPYLRDLYRIPMLSHSRERGMFLKYHYLRLLASRQQKELDPQVSTYRQLKRFDALRRQARLLRAHIVEANLRLVVSVARKHVRAGVTLMELVSEGNVTLIRAAESFDVHRGHRFSTYAVYALMRGFARYIADAIDLRRGAQGPDFLAEVGEASTSRVDEQMLARDQVAHLLSQLEPRERAVLAGRFGLRKAEMTCRDLAVHMHLSSQRIVQIEHAALAKLREMAT